MKNGGNETSNSLHDIYDGRVWKEFVHVNNTPFLAASNHLGLMLNVNWFNLTNTTPLIVLVLFIWSF